MLILETDTRKNEEVETGEGEGGKNFILSPYHKCRLHTLRRFGPLFSKQVFYDHYYYYYYYIMGKKENRRMEGKSKLHPPLPLELDQKIHTNTSSL